MNMFSNLAEAKMEETTDVVGGSKFDPVPSGIYDATVKLMYAGEAQSGAKNVTVVLDVDGSEVSETIYVTNKAGDPFYVDKESGKNMPLPGYQTINELCLLTTEQELSEVDMENKTVKIYNFTERKELPTEVPVIVDALTKPVKVAVFREIVDKEKKGDDGKYHPTGETRTQNTIVKFMQHETSRTVNEYMREIEQPEWATEWIERHSGKDRNKARGAASGGQSGTGRPGSSGGSGTGKPTKKLFGK